MTSYKAKNEPVHEANMFESTMLSFCSDGKLNGIAIWMEYDIDECNTISYGITESVKPGCCPKWNMLRQQGNVLHHC